jgi:hypothetical protein
VRCGARNKDGYSLGSESAFNMLRDERERVATRFTSPIMKDS